MNGWTAFGGLSGGIEDSCADWILNAPCVCYSVICTRFRPPSLAA